MTMRIALLLSFCFCCFHALEAQTVYPMDTAHWNITARGHILERYEGKDALYLQGGMATLKNTQFLNGTIEFDLYLTERQSYPGVQFRAFDDRNAETFFVRPHLSGKEDANQAAPVINDIVAFQLYFGPSYSFSYSYSFDDWTHVKLVIHEDKAQVFLDYSETPHLCWYLQHPPQAGEVSIGHGFAAQHYANFTIDPSAHTLVDFKVTPPRKIPNLIPEWQLSDMFAENLLDDPAQLDQLIKDRKWGKSIQVEEGVAANIAREIVLYDGSPGNTVFAKVNVHSDKAQLKHFEFGYSDRVVVILNGKPLYRGNNRWRSRDYRYLGTIGLFDGVYLDLKKGNNTLLLAVSEDFGGWLVTGKFPDGSGLTIK